MTWRPTRDPASALEPPQTAVTTVIEPRHRDLGSGFGVRRLLPAAVPNAGGGGDTSQGPRHIASVGPFVFFDHFGPTQFAPGQGLDVRPHPHINLATVTYLFEGEILHRDSLGSRQAIRPGDINWMTAGRGIVHSERTDTAARAAGSRAHGLQLWVGLPRAHEETAPAFHHHPAATLPELVERGVTVRVLAGEAYGLKSPVHTFSRLVYLDVQMEPGAVLELPDDDGDRGVYLVDGAVNCQGPSEAPSPPFAAWRMLSLRPGQPVQLRAQIATRLVLIGGDAFPEPRHIWWNFVSSSEARLQQAREDWRERRGDTAGPFPLVPGDEDEFIPLPAS